MQIDPRDRLHARVARGGGTGDILNLGQGAQVAPQTGVEADIADPAHHLAHRIADILDGKGRDLDDDHVGRADRVGQEWLQRGIGGEAAIPELLAIDLHRSEQLG